MNTTCPVCRSESLPEACAPATYPDVVVAGLRNLRVIMIARASGAGVREIMEELQDDSLPADVATRLCPYCRSGTVQWCDGSPMIVDGLLLLFGRARSLLRLRTDKNFSWRAVLQAALDGEQSVPVDPAEPTASPDEYVEQWDTPDPGAYAT